MSDTALPTTATELGAPTVVVDHVDVTYRVYADGAPKLRKLFIGDRTQRTYRSVEAVRNVTFVARTGEAIGIIGHNGSGKSTLLRAIAGLVPVTAGNVHASSLPVLLGVAAALEPDISGRRNIFLGGTALGIKRAHLEARMDEIVEFAGLEDFIDLPLRTYSSGMRSRLQFAIATAVTPDILMVDEALSTGDAEFKERSDTRIREMMAEAGTIFLVSHSLKSIKDVCTRTLWMDHGRLVADGEPGEVVAAYEEHVARRKAARKPKATPPKPEPTPPAPSPGPADATSQAGARAEAPPADARAEAPPADVRTEAPHADASDGASEANGARTAKP